MKTYQLKIKGKKKKKRFEGEFTALERLKRVFTKLQKPHQNQLQNGITALHLSFTTKKKKKKLLFTSDLWVLIKSTISILLLSLSLSEHHRFK